MGAPDDILLYSIPPSFYSQIARLALVEKAVVHRRINVAPGPPFYETYQPWYMRLNPMGTVPTLVARGQAIDDSRTIVLYVDREFEGPSLFPSEPELLGEVNHWVSEAYQIPERVLAYGKDNLKNLGVRTNRGRLKALRKWSRRQPDMAGIYANKIADIELFMCNAADQEYVESIWAATGKRLDLADACLRERTFCCGDMYTAADVVWTVTVARQLMLGCDPFDGRPALQQWFVRMQGRPSFDEADVWARFKFEVMLPVLLWKLKWYVLGAGAVATLVTIGLIAWLGG